MALLERRPTKAAQVKGASGCKPAAATRRRRTRALRDEGDGECDDSDVARRQRQPSPCRTPTIFAAESLGRGSVVTTYLSGEHLWLSIAR